MLISTFTDHFALNLKKKTPISKTLQININPSLASILYPFQNPTNKREQNFNLSLIQSQIKHILLVIIIMLMTWT